MIFISKNQSFHQELLGKKIEHLYIESLGEHNALNTGVVLYLINYRCLKTILVISKNKDCQDYISMILTVFN